jgi:hypothetical protein
VEPCNILFSQYAKIYINLAEIFNELCSRVKRRFDTAGKRN